MGNDQRIAVPWSRRLSRFRDQYLPHPVIPTLAPNARFLADHKVIGTFEQGSYFTAVAYFSKLKLWLQAHLLWDPSQDGEALVNEFLNGYYGAAGPHLKD